MIKQQIFAYFHNNNERNTYSDWWTILNKLEQLWLGRSWISKQQHIDVSSTSETVWKSNRHERNRTSALLVTSCKRLRIYCLAIHVLVWNLQQLIWLLYTIAGHSGLAVTSPTAVWDIQGSNLTTTVVVESITRATVIYSLGHKLLTLTAMPTSTQPATLHGTVKMNIGFQA